MSERANKIIEALKKEDWGTLYDERNIMIQQKLPTPKELKEPLYIHKWTSAHISGKTLDVGCGSGYLEHINKGIYGVDISPKSIEYCKKHVGKNFKVMDGEDLKYSDNTFDTVVSNETLEHVINPKKMLSEMIRVLKPSGKMIVTVPIGNSLAANGRAGHIHFWRFYDIMHLFEEYGEDFKIYWLNKWHKYVPNSGEVMSKNIFGVIWRKENGRG